MTIVGITDIASLSLSPSLSLFIKTIVVRAITERAFRSALLRKLRCLPASTAIAPPACDKLKLNCAAHDDAVDFSLTLARFWESNLNKRDVGKYGRARACLLARLLHVVSPA